MLSPTSILLKGWSQGTGSKGGEIPLLFEKVLGFSLWSCSIVIVWHSSLSPCFSMSSKSFISWKAVKGTLSLPYGIWWRTTPIATKAWHYGAGGADTRARPAPSTGEDEGCQFSLHQVRTSSRHDTSHRARARVELSILSFLLLWTFLACTCLSGPLHIFFFLF